MDHSVAQPIVSSQHDVLPVVAQAADAPIVSAIALTNVSVAPSTDSAAERNTDADTVAPAAEDLVPAEEPAEEKTPLRPDVPMIVFAYACLRREFGALLARQPAEDGTPPPEDVHQMRIATRRLRVALRLFRRMLPKAAGDFRKEFSRFARALGEVRDLDVYGENFRTYAEAVPPENVDELGGYELHLRRERAEARERLAALFGDARHTRLLKSFGKFLDGEPSPAALRRWGSFKIADGADRYLRKSLKRVRKLGRKIGDDAHAKDLHRLRIRTKRFRYELEFFVAVYPSLGKTAKATKVLQDLLGVHQDACTATERLETYARSLGKRRKDSMPAGLATLVASQRQQARDVRAKFGAEWRTFEHAVARGGKLTA
jgi:CHAD domain-containing protein